MKECSKCRVMKQDYEFGKDLRNKKGMKSICKKCDNEYKCAKDSLKYDASCIKVLHIDEIDIMPISNAVLMLAQKYGRDEDFIRRSLQSCDNAGVTRNYFVTRYLLGNKDIPLNELVDFQARVLQGFID